jgi:hypothetical protein
VFDKALASTLPVAALDYVPRIAVAGEDEDEDE